MLRFVVYAVPLLVLLMLVFGLAVDFFEGAPAARLALQKAPPQIALMTWLLEAFGLLALFLLVEGKSGLWWFDGVLAGWVAWIFRGPLLVVTLVVAFGRAQKPWWDLVLAWWGLYTVCGLALAVLYRRRTAVAGARQAEEPE